MPAVKQEGADEGNRISSELNRGAKREHTGGLPCGAAHAFEVRGWGTGAPAGNCRAVIPMN
jgi:hypothetical protein